MQVVEIVMKNTKRYRAATLRKALQQIQRELGEDALVLGHKKIKAGGIFGIGARELVEVHVAGTAAGVHAGGPSAAVSPRPVQQQAEPDPTANSGQPAGLAKSGPSLRAVMASRAYAEAANNRFNASTDSAQLEPVSPTRITPAQPTPNHQRKAEHAPRPEVASVRANQVSSELSKLRAEFRELKLSLSLAGRPIPATSTSQTGASDLEACPEMYDSPYFEAYMAIAESGLSRDLARQAVETAIRGKHNHVTVEGALSDVLRSIVRFADEAPAFDSAPGGRCVTAFVGPTGVGKTTTIAKLAARATISSRRRVDLITLDTYRIAAVDQLRKYAEVIGAGCHVARSVAELDGLIQQHSGESRIFIDTAGRSPNDLADQLELADYLRQTPSIFKYLVLQATTNLADAIVATKKFELFGSDCLVVTKLDETTVPGVAATIAGSAGLPLAYLCASQRIPEQDLQPASPEALARRILRSTLLIAAVAA